MQPLAGSSSSRLFYERLPRLVDGLSNASLDVRIESLEGLALLVDSSTDTDLSDLCHIVRERGGCEALSLLMTDDEPVVHQNAMLVLGNVASERVDAGCIATKELLRRSGALEMLMPHLWSEVYDTVLYALGALLNLCADVAYVEILQEAQVPTRLQELAECGDSHLERFAKGCLHNIREAILQLLALQKADVSRMQAFARGFLARRFCSRLRREKMFQEADVQLEHEQMLDDAAERIQAAARRRAARLMMLRLWRRRSQLKAATGDLASELIGLVLDEEAEAIAAEAALVEVVIREESEMIAVEAAIIEVVIREEAELVAAEAIEEGEAGAVALSLLNQVLDQEAAAVAVEALMESATDELASELLSLVLDEEAEAIAIEADLVEVVIREEMMMLAVEALAVPAIVEAVIAEETAMLAGGLLAEEVIEEAVVAEEAAKVAAEALAQYQVEREDDALQATIALMNDVVDKEVDSVSSQAQTTHVLVELVVGEEVAKVAAEALALAAEEAAQLALDTQLVMDDLIEAVVCSIVRPTAAWQLARRGVMRSLREERERDLVADCLINEVVASIARANASWLLARAKVTRAVKASKLFALPAVLILRAQKSSTAAPAERRAPAAHKPPRSSAFAAAPRPAAPPPPKQQAMRASRSAVELPAKAIALYSTVPLPPLRTSNSANEVAAANKTAKQLRGKVEVLTPEADLPPVRATPKPKAKPKASPPKPKPKPEPKKIEMRQHKPLALATPPSASERALSVFRLQVDNDGYAVLPDAKPRPMFGLKKSKHTSFPDLHILDKTQAHAVHLKDANEVDAAAIAQPHLFGLRWERVGSDPDDPSTHGAELINAGLANSLGAGTLVFTRREFDAFGVKELRPEHYVRRNGGYFRPAGSLRGSLLKGAGRLDATSGESIAIQLNKLLASASGKLLDLFREWDLDSDGKIDFQELRQALQQLGWEAPNAQYREMFRALGGGDDGWLEYGELKRALTRSGVSWHSGWCRSTPVSQSGEAANTSKGIAKIKKEAHYINGAHPLAPRPAS